MLKLAHGIDPLCVLQSGGAWLRCLGGAVNLTPSREGIRRGLKGRRHGINPQEVAVPGLRTCKATNQWLMDICRLAGETSKALL